MIPPFLMDYIPSKGISETQATLYRATLANWLKVHAYVQKLPMDKWSTLHTIAGLMFVEYYRKGGPRMDIITRLYGRFNRVRHDLEVVQLGNRRRR